LRLIMAEYPVHLFSAQNSIHEPLGCRIDRSGKHA
jgi:hypothetical protein